MIIYPSSECGFAVKEKNFHVNRRTLTKSAVLGAVTAGGAGGIVTGSQSQSSDVPETTIYLTLTPTVTGVESLTGRQRALFTQLTTGETPRRVGYTPITADEFHPSGGARIVEADGTYYRIDIERAGKARAKRYTIGVERTDANAPVSVSSLPPAQARVVSRLISRNDEASRRGLPDDYEREVLTPPAADASVFVPNPPTGTVSSDGQAYRVTVRRESVEGAAYRYDTTVVADDEAVFESWLDDRQLTTVDTVPTGESILQAAIDSRYDVTRPTEAYRTVLTALFGESQSVHDERTAAIEYDGTAYEALNGVVQA